VVFIESRSFTARLQQLAGPAADDVLRMIQDDLLRNLDRGDVVRGLGGIRKARVANVARGKGKRGGYRYLYLYLQGRNHVHLLFLLDKNEAEDLNNVQRAALRKMATELRRI
jgi:hypothetical protein